ncbi:hypothetical protein EBU99_14520 [bacterium]|nr:hypothetical protein [bacterium]
MKRTPQVLDVWFECWFYSSPNTVAFPPIIQQFSTLVEAVDQLKAQRSQFWLIEQFSYVKYIDKEGNEKTDRTKAYFADVRFGPI